MKNLFLAMVTIVIIFSSCGDKRSNEKPLEYRDHATIGLKCFITSDGKEYSGFRNGVFMDCPKGVTIVASVFQMGEDSVQIMYSSLEYGNGAYSWITSLKNYNGYETHRIRARVFEIKNAVSDPITVTDSLVTLPTDTIKN